MLFIDLFSERNILNYEVQQTIYLGQQALWVYLTLFVLIYLLKEVYYMVAEWYPQLNNEQLLESDSSEGDLEDSLEEEPYTSNLIGGLINYPKTSTS